MRLFSLFLIVGLFSCSAKYHYNKALKKGLEVTQTSDTIRISTIDSIPVIKHDTIVYEHFYTSKDTVVYYKNVYVPKTRLETRIEYKLKRDTIKMITRVEVQRAKADAKINKKPNYWGMLIFVACVFLVGLFGTKLVNKYL
jgi:hypothetical protein|tara:strand:+ start:2999 stop:3421 length:423 start_codon:yes stop_codon:yes gene_type:complete